MRGRGGEMSSKGESQSQVESRVLEEEGWKQKSSRKAYTPNGMKKNQSHKNLFKSLHIRCVVL